MSNEMQDEVDLRAIEWHVRLRDGDDGTWDRFVDWLAEDPHHARAYDRIEAMDRDLDAFVPDLRQAISATVGPHAAATGRRGMGLWIGGGLAAAMAAAFAFTFLPGSQRYDVMTAAGEQRTIRLGANTEVTLNGDTKLVLDRKDRRFAALIRGQALFTVAHDSAHPFVVEAGADRIVDLGTVFEVVREPGELRVAVAEGRVEYRGKAGVVPLAAGAAMRLAKDGRHHVTQAPAQEIGAWRNERLTYSERPLAEVARDLGRTLGISIRVAPSIAQRPFSGNINVSGTSEEAMRRLQFALNVTIAKQGDVWIMSSADREVD